MKIENAWMLLPGRKVGFGTVETDGDTISAVRRREPGESDRIVLPGLDAALLSPLEQELLHLLEMAARARHLG